MVRAERSIFHLYESASGSLLLLHLLLRQSRFNPTIVQLVAGLQKITSALGSCFNPTIVQLVENKLFTRDPKRVVSILR